MTGYELSLSLFYVIPISLVIWILGRRPGILASLTRNQPRIRTHCHHKTSRRATGGNAKKQLAEITSIIGVLTCNDAPSNTEVLIKMTDDLMYSVKSSSKNVIKYSSTLIVCY
jgi:GGDEF domain-containing protein